MTKKRLLFRSLVLVALMIVINKGGAWAQDSRINLPSGSITLTANKTYQFKPVISNGTNVKGGGIYVATGAKVTGTNNTFSNNIITGTTPTAIMSRNDQYYLQGGVLYLDGEKVPGTVSDYHGGNATFSGDTKFVNNSITFNSVYNNVSSKGYGAIVYGGAIFSNGSLTFNGKTTFANNKISGTMTDATAMCKYALEGSALFLDEYSAVNNTVTFNDDLDVTGNSISVTDMNVVGGSTYNTRYTFNISGKSTQQLYFGGKTTFSNNTAIGNFKGSLYYDTKSTTTVHLFSGTSMGTIEGWTVKDTMTFSNNSSVLNFEATGGEGESITSDGNALSFALYSNGGTFKKAFIIDGNTAKANITGNGTLKSPIFKAGGTLNGSKNQPATLTIEGDLKIINNKVDVNIENGISAYKIYGSQNSPTTPKEYVYTLSSLPMVCKGDVLISGNAQTLNGKQQGPYSNCHAIHNEGCNFTFAKKLTLATEGDCWVNTNRTYDMCSTMTWDLTGGLESHACLENFQYYKAYPDTLPPGITEQKEVELYKKSRDNFYSNFHQYLLVKAEQPIGKYVIATGDFSDMKNTDKFVLKNASSEKDTLDIAVGGGTVIFNNLAYSLTIDDNGTSDIKTDDKLYLNVGTCLIGNKAYKTFADAWAAIQEGDTLVLNKDITDEDARTIPVDNFTINLNGYNYTNSSQFTASYDLNVIDTKASSTAKFSLAKIVVDDGIYVSGPIVAAKSTLNGIAMFCDKADITNTDLSGITIASGKGIGLAEGSKLTAKSINNYSQLTVDSSYVKITDYVLKNYSGGYMNFRKANLEFTGTLGLFAITGGSVDIDAGETNITTTNQTSLSLSKGMLNIKEGAKLSANKNFYLSDTTNVYGTLNSTSGSITNNKTLNLFGGTLEATGTITNKDTLNLQGATLKCNNSSYVVNNANATINVLEGNSAISTGYVRSLVNIGVLNLEKGAVLSAPKPISNSGIINLRDGNFSPTVNIINSGKINWDITDKIASVLYFDKLTNSGELCITPGLAQPKDTTYLLAQNAVTIPQTFTLTGIDGKSDKTLVLNGTYVYYGNRCYKIYKEREPQAKTRNGGKVRPTVIPWVLKLEVKPFVCKNKDTGIYYEYLDTAIAKVKTGETIELITDIEMTDSLEMPACTYLDLKGFKLTNPQGLDLKWDLTKDNAPVIKDFDKLAAQGTLTLNMNDLQTRQKYVIANDAANASGREFILTGAPTADKKDRSVTVGGEPVFYGHRHYSLALEGTNIVLNVTKVTPPSGEFWGVSVDGSQLSLTIDDNFNVSHTGDSFIQKDNLTHFQFNGPITRIGVATLKGNLNLKEVYFPESVEFIGQDAIRDCENLEYANMLDIESTAIGPNAFEGCKKLSIVEWPAKLEEIDAFAFAYCESLKEITLPATLQRIYGNAFSYCSDLKSVTLLSTSMERLWAESFDKCHKDLAIYVPYLNLTDYEALSSARGLNFQTKIPVSNYGSGKNTVYCHHNMIIPDGVTFWTMNTDRTEQKVTQQFVPGGAGYVVKFEAGVNSVEVVTTSQLATIAYRNILTGVNKATAVSEILKGYDSATLYKMDPSTGSFYSFTSEMPAYQAFYVMQGGIPVSFTYDEATGIANVDADGDADADSDSYNAAGQKVANGYKGIVIKNGKKYLNK